MHTESAVAEWSLQLSRALAELIAKLIAKGATKLAAALLAALSDPAQHPGLIKIMDLNERGDTIRIVRMEPEQYAEFSKEAAHYGLFYATNKLKDGLQDVMIGESQLEMLNQLLENIGVGTLSKNAETPSQSSEESKESSTPTLMQDATERGDTMPSKPTAAAPTEQVSVSAPKEPHTESSALIDGQLAEQPIVKQALDKLPTQDRRELSGLVTQIDRLDQQMSSMHTQLESMHLERQPQSSPLHAIGRGITNTLHWGRDRLNGIKGILFSVCKSLAEDTKVHTLGILSRLLDVVGIRKRLGAVADALNGASEKIDRLQAVAPETEQATSKPQPVQSVPPVSQAEPPEQPVSQPEPRHRAESTEKPSVVSKVEQIAQRQQSEAHPKVTPAPVKQTTGMER